MFDGGINIQSHPTITLYEKKRNGELRFFVYASQDFALNFVELREIVYPVGTFVVPASSSEYSLLSVVLRSIIQNVGTFNGSGTQASQTFGLQSAVLRTVLINFPTVYKAEVVNSTYGLQSAVLTTVVKNIGPFTSSPVNSTYGLRSVVLS